jgi:hypothetical protein
LRGWVRKLNESICICNDHAVYHLFQNSGEACVSEFTVKVAVQGGLQRCDGAGKVFNLFRSVGVSLVRCVPGENIHSRAVLDHSTPRKSRWR